LLPVGQRTLNLRFLPTYDVAVKVVMVVAVIVEVEGGGGIPMRHDTVCRSELLLLNGCTMLSRGLAAGQYRPGPAERILREHEGALRDLHDERAALLVGRVVDAALQHAAPVAVRGDLHTARARRVVHKLVVLIVGPIEIVLSTL